MRAIIAPTYKDIFGHTEETPEKLLEDIPVPIIIAVIGVFNAELYLSEDHNKAQLNILHFLLRRQNPQLFANIVNYLREFKRTSHNEVAIFSIHTNLNVLHYGIIHGSYTSEVSDTLPYQELNLFKAYLLISESEYSKVKIVKNKSVLVNYRMNTWPMMAGQIQANHSLNYITDMIKAKCWFDYMQFESGYEKYVTTFLKKNNSPNSWSYIINLAAQITNARENYSSSNLAPAYINADETSRGIYVELCLDLKGYKQKFRDGKMNYLGFKDKPLFEFKYNSFIVIDWNLLAGKIYQGLLFDFFKHSGISQQPRFKDPISLKNFVSKESVEGYLFKKLIASIFKNKHSEIVFDDTNKQGFPDAYVRIGSKILIFELKDAFSSSQVIESRSYEHIKNSVDQKYNNKKKGTGQLLKHIKLLLEENFEERSFESLKLKRRNLIIYPILLYTDDFYSLPGVSLYLQEQFRTEVVKKELSGAFKQIKPLGFFNLNFLLENIHFLIRKESSLQIILDSAFDKLKQREKRFRNNNSLENLHLWNQDLDRIMRASIKNWRLDDDKFLNTVFRELDLKRGL